MSTTLIELPAGRRVGQRVLLTITVLDARGGVVHGGDLRGLVVADDHYRGMTLLVGEEYVRLPRDGVDVALAERGAAPLAARGGDVDLLASWRIDDPRGTPAVFWWACGRRKDDPSGKERGPLGR